MAIQNECNHIVTLGYLNNFIKENLWDSGQTSIHVDYKDKGSSFCPTHKDLLDGKFLPTYNSSSIDKDGIEINGEYDDNQLVIGKNVSLTYTRFNSFTITPSSTFVSSYGGQITLDYSFKVDETTIALLEDSCEPMQMTQTYTANTNVRYEITPGSEYASISGNVLTVSEHGAATATTRTIRITAYMTYRGREYKSADINIIQQENSSKYLTFTALDDNTTFSFSGLSGNTVEYSINDGANWETLSNDGVTVQSGNKVIWKASEPTLTDFGIGSFKSNGHFTIEGNPMSLLYGNEFVSQRDLTGKDYAFESLFDGCGKLTNAKYLSLPATTLSKGCYTKMFLNCHGLTTAPIISSVTLANFCYAYMFDGCNNLTEAPALIATTLKDECYYYMFAGCTSLTTPPVLSATTLANGCYKNMFSGCTSLATAPELPFTTLADSCYQGMFAKCTNLTTAPSLVATTLTINCYNSMFYGCTSLTTTPNLLATTLAEGCYANMFNGCTSLTTVPNLIATTLTPSCYAYMFEDCTSLTTVPSNYLPYTTLSYACYNGMFSRCSSLTTTPNLQATTLADNCYDNMFQGCTSLQTAPELPATTLANGCYQGMFSGCTSLTTAPELLATTLANGCYQGMFSSCSSLNSITCLATDISANMCTYYWVNGVADEGKFIHADGMSSWTRGDNGIPTNWISADYSGSEYLTFVATENGEFRFIGNDISYSKNNSEWATLASNTPLIVNSGDVVMWKANLTPISNNGIGMFGSTRSFVAKGNPMSLLYGDNFVNQTSLSGYDYAFNELFNGCIGLTSAEEIVLPATILATSCYQYMFKNCTSLAAAPNLLATNLSEYCYRNMFEGCTSLTTAPELPATTLADSCYEAMFYDCASLTTVHSLPATVLASDCYNQMFYGCTSLQTVPSNMLPATILADSCYQDMFNGCISLLASPDLNAPILVSACYANMFENCSNLNSITCLATDISAMNCTLNWVNEVAANGIFTKANGMDNWEIDSADGIPNGWSVIQY